MDECVFIGWLFDGRAFGIAYCGIWLFDLRSWNSNFKEICFQVLFLKGAFMISRC